MTPEVSATLSDLRTKSDMIFEGILPGIRVIPGREAAKLRCLSAEIERLEAACVAARAELERQRDTARAEGRAEGYSEGRADSLNLVSEAVRFRAEMCETLPAEAMDLAFAIAGRMLDREIDRDPAVFCDLVAAWKLDACGSGPCTIRLNPSDAAAMDPGAGGLVGVSIVADADLPRGACRIFAGDGVFDAGFDARIEALRNATL